MANVVGPCRGPSSGDRHNPVIIYKYRKPVIHGGETVATEKDAQLHLSMRLGINSGNDLLSRKLDKHYHRRCGVSLPCSGWERVGPPRKNHQKIRIATRFLGAWHLRSCQNFKRTSSFSDNRILGQTRNSNDLNLHEADRRMKKAERTLVVLS